MNNMPVAPVKSASLHHHHHHLHSTPVSTSALQITGSHLTGATVGDLQIPLIAASTSATSKHKKSSKHHHHHHALPDNLLASAEPDEPLDRKPSKSKKTHKEKPDKTASSSKTMQQPQLTAHPISTAGAPSTSGVQESGGKADQAKERKKSDREVGDKLPADDEQDLTSKL